MTQEDKQLLLQDLSSRLPYGVIINSNSVSGELLSIDKSINGGIVVTNRILSNSVSVNVIEYIKPYLRPMPSMTEKEIKELQEIAVALSYNKDDIIIGAQINSFRQLDSVLDFFNSHHFDYRGLIEKGLALEAPDDMYNLKKK